MILTVTVNPALDKSTSVDNIRPKDKLRCEPPTFEPGGGGVNISRAIHKLGGKSVAVYTEGGPIGEYFSKLLREEGVETDPVKIRNFTRENLQVEDKQSGELYRFGMPGAELNDQECEKLLERVASYRDAKFVVASGSLPPGAPTDFYAQLARQVKKIDARFILDTSGEALKAASDEQLYLIKPNLRELNDLVGDSLENIEEQEEAATEWLRTHSVEVMVVSLGASGALLVTEHGAQNFPAPSIKKKSPVGAGDSMLAGIVSKLEEGRSIQHATLYGIACGSAASMTPGTNLLHKKDADNLFEYTMNKLMKAEVS